MDLPTTITSKKKGEADDDDDQVIDFTPASDRVEQRTKQERATALTGSGNLLLEQSGQWRSFPVKDGRIESSEGKVIGEIHANGDVVLNGRRFNLGTAGEAGSFLGVTGDGQALHLTDKKSQESGFFGQFISADGRQKLTVVANNIYDGQAKFVGRLSGDGSVQLANGDPVAINSFRDGWSFRGTEAGKPRAFQTGADQSNGFIFMRETPGAEPKKYSVRMGMLIDDVTGEQRGMIAPPTVRPDRSLEGGSISLTGANGVTTRPLASLDHAVFELKRLGVSGGNEDVNDQYLRGVTLGGAPMADGRDQPMKGIFSIGQALTTEHRRDNLAANNKVRIEQEFNASVARVEDSTAYEHMAQRKQRDLDTEDMRSRFAHQTMDTLTSILRTGKVNDEDIAHIRQRIEVSKQELSANPLEYQRNALDGWQQKSEPLPTDTSQINGTVKVPSGKGQVETWTIRNGQITAPGGMTGRIESVDGTVSLTVDKSERQLPMPRLVGAVWHLEYQSDDGKPVVQDLISMGNRVVSAQDIRQRALAEQWYAYNANAAAGNSETSHQAYVAATKARERGEQTLTAILQNGVRSKSDLDYLSNAGAEVRPEALRTSKTNKREEIGLPPLTQESLSHTKGMLRIGSDVYRIDGGNLIDIHDDKAERVGRLLPNYQVELPGRGVLSLAEQNRVLLEFQQEGEDRVHRIIGTGPAQVGFNGYKAGGLVNTDELIRQAFQDLGHARNGNAEYFEQRPYLTGGFASWAMGGRDEALREFAKQLGKDVEYLQKEIGTIFKEGFDSERCSNARLDPFIKQTDATINYIGKQSASTQSLAAEGIELQRQINEGVYVAAITVATAGAGAGFAALSQTARIVEMGRMGQAMMFVGETATTAMTHGMLSAGVRSSERSDLATNFSSGMLQGSVAGLGSAGGRILNANSTINAAEKLLEKAKTGATLSAQEQQVLNSVMGRLVSSGHANVGRIANETFETGSAALHSMAYAQADQMRYHTAEGATPQQFALGLITSRLGHLSGQGLRNATKSDLVNGVASNTTSSYFTGVLQETPRALERDRQRVGAQLGVPAEWLSGEVYARNQNLGALIEDLHHAGLMSAASTPFVTATSLLVRGGVRAYQDRQAEKARQQAERDQQSAMHDAIAQSNSYSNQHEISGRIQDGFRNAGAETTFAEDGSFNKGWRAATLVDRQNDEALRVAIDTAKARFGHLPERERAEAVARYAHELLNSAEPAPGRANNDAQVERWSAQFGQEHAGQSIPLGTYIRQGRGVCAEQALLTKVLADEVGLNATLVRGDKNGGNQLNHTWVDFTFADKSKASSDSRSGRYLFVPERGYLPGSKMENPDATAYEGSGAQGLGSRVGTTPDKSAAAESWHGSKYFQLNADGSTRYGADGLPKYRNEDQSLITPDRNVCAVIDGMGGHGGGEAAAAIARNSILQNWQRFPTKGTEAEKTKWMYDTVRDAHDAIIVEQERAFAAQQNRQPAVYGTRPDGSEIYSGPTMGATLVMTARHDDKLLIAWAGDARAYRLREGRLEQLTVDDHIPGRPKHLVTNAIGIPAGVKVNQTAVEIKPGDRILLASDGLESLSHTEIESALVAKRGSAAEASAALLEAVKAKAKPRQDNVTAVVVDVEDKPVVQRPSTQPAPGVTPGVRLSAVIDRWKNNEIDGCAVINSALAKVPAAGQLNMINKTAAKLEANPDLRQEFLLTVTNNPRLTRDSQVEAASLLALHPPEDSAGVSRLAEVARTHPNKVVRALAANASDPIFRDGSGKMIMSKSRGFALQGAASLLNDYEERKQLLQIAVQIRQIEGGAQ
jgi:protein phosphatase